MNLYGYTIGDPVNLMDLFGLRPGDKYPTQDSAAINAITDINPTSISQGREYGGYTYQNSDGSYSYTAPLQGTKDSVILGSPPPGVETKGYYHTHGANDPGYKNEDFSQADKNVAKNIGGTGYLGAPSGAIKKYDPESGKVTDITPKKCP